MAKTQLTSVNQLSAKDIRNLANELRNSQQPAVAKQSVLVAVAVGFSNVKGAFAQARDSYLVAEHLRKQ